MGTYDATFDASGIEPLQSGGRHQVGNKFPATVTNTDVKDTKDNSGKYFEVEFTSPGGTIKGNYNLWNNSPQAVKIAAGQLSALCHATGIFQINMRDGGKNLRGAKCLIDVGFQNGQEPTAEKPEGGYVEIKKVYDINGNEPGKGGSQSHQQQPQQQNWGSGGNQQQPQSQPQGSSWGGNAQPNQPQQQQPQQQQPQVQNGGNWGTSQQTNAPSVNSGGGWQQGSTQQTPPWNNK